MRSAETAEPRSECQGARLDLDSIEDRFRSVTSSAAWRALEEAVIEADALLIFGTGGNLAIAQHAEADLLRLTEKRISAPGGSVAVTALANEFGEEEWLSMWALDELRGAGQADGVAAIGLSCSGVSLAVMAALRDLGVRGAIPILIAGKSPRQVEVEHLIELDARFYHSAETLMSLLMYQLAVACGGQPKRLGD